MKRQIISEEIATISPYDVGGSIESIVKQLQERFLPTDRLVWCPNCDGGDYTIIRNRPENDKEYAARIKKEERARAKKDKEKKQQEERERAEYLRLKKKFEKG